jgi:phage shock protein PspC (stress-responsive transcriptional regulator)
MSTTDEHPTPSGDQVQDPGPSFNRDRFHDIDQLQLSSSDRYIAGVAGGLGRHFGIDPIIVRVVLAGLCVFGGIGILLYGVLWAFVPSDRTGRAIIDLNGPTRRAVLLIFGGIVALGIVGSFFGGGLHGWDGGFAWPLAAVVAAVAVALAYLRPSNYRAKSTPINPTGADVVPPTTPVPPSAPFVPVAPKPRKTGLILFWPTIAAIIGAFGVLGIVAVDNPLAPLWWPGTALAIVGLALVVGSFVGRPGGLIPLGVLLMPPVIATTVLGANGWHHSDLNVTPTSVSAVASNYSIGTGQANLDLSQVSDPAALAGRTLRVHMTAGQIDVILPPGIRTDVNAKLDVAGDVQVPGNEQSGLEPSVNQMIGSGSGAPLHLVLDGRVGQIKVETNYAVPSN